MLYVTEPPIDQPHSWCWCGTELEDDGSCIECRTDYGIDDWDDHYEEPVYRDGLYDDQC